VREGGSRRTGSLKIEICPPSPTHSEGSNSRSHCSYHRRFQTARIAGFARKNSVVALRSEFENLLIVTPTSTRAHPPDEPPSTPNLLPRILEWSVMVRPTLRPTRATSPLSPVKETEIFRGEGAPSRLRLPARFRVGGGGGVEGQDWGQPTHPPTPVGGVSFSALSSLVQGFNFCR